MRNVAEGLGRDISGLAGRGMSIGMGMGGRDRERSKDRGAGFVERESWGSRIGEMGGGTLGKTRDKEREREKEKEGKGVEVTEAQVRLARRKADGAERVLLERYNALAARTLASHKAMAESRRVCLENLPRIEGTLASLKGLLREAEGMVGTLKDETIPGATREAEGQIERLRGNIERMERERVVGLQKRVEVARERVGELGGRMDAVRARVNGWEEREVESARRRRRRVGVVWGVVATLVIVMIVVVVLGKMSEDAKREEERRADWSNWTETAVERAGNRNWTAGKKVEDILKEVSEEVQWGGGGNGSGVREGATEMERRSEIEEDGRLERMFDEL